MTTKHSGLSKVFMIPTEPQSSQMVAHEVFMIVVKHGGPLHLDNDAKHSWLVNIVKKGCVSTVHVLQNFSQMKGQIYNIFFFYHYLHYILDFMEPLSSS